MSVENPIAIDRGEKNQHPLDRVPQQSAPGTDPKKTKGLDLKTALLIGNAIVSGASSDTGIILNGLDHTAMNGDNPRVRFMSAEQLNELKSGGGIEWNVDGDLVIADIVNSTETEGEPIVALSDEADSAALEQLLQSPDRHAGVIITVEQFFDITSNLSDTDAESDAQLNDAIRAEIESLQSFVTGEEWLDESQVTPMISVVRNDDGTVFFSPILFTNQPINATEDGRQIEGQQNSVLIPYERIDAQSGNLVLDVAVLPVQPGEQIVFLPFNSNILPAKLDEGGRVVSVLAQQDDGYITESSIYSPVLTASGSLNLRSENWGVIGTATPSADTIQVTGTLQTVNGNEAYPVTVISPDGQYTEGFLSSTLFDSDLTDSIASLPAYRVLSPELTDALSEAGGFSDLSPAQQANLNDLAVATAEFNAGSAAESQEYLDDYAPYGMVAVVDQYVETQGPWAIYLMTEIGPDGNRTDTQWLVGYYTPHVSNYGSVISGDQYCATIPDGAGSRPDFAIGQTVAILGEQLSAGDPLPFAVEGTPSIYAMSTQCGE